METLQVIEKIKRSAKAMPKVRVIQEMKIGQVVRQGDIYIERVKEIEGKGNAITSRQLAPGTTKGSRHIVGDSPAVTIWKSKPSLNGKAAFQIGPAIEAVGDLSITHPEHAFIKFLVKSKQCFQVWFQSDWARQARTKD